MESGPTGPNPGELLGRYQIQREIGRGGMGAIYLARDTTLRRPVALKVLIPSATDGRNLRERFVREAQAAAKIRHRNVVAVHDVHDGETPFIVLEFLEGETLDALFKREGRLPFARALDLLLPVMSAVRAAHEAGVIHRDLKPANIMIARESDGAYTPKVLDFGISKVAQVTGLFHAAPAAGPGLTGEGDCIGTPNYMPPEQHGAQLLVGPWSDVYALGLMLYVAVAGKRAFPGRDAGEVLRAKFMGTFLPPSARAAGLPRELDAWMVKALARDVPQRFASVQAMAWALLAFAPPEVRARWGPSFAPSEEVLEVSAVEDAPEEERTTPLRGEASVDVVFDEPLARTKLSAVVPIPPAAPARRGGGLAALSLGALLVASAALGWRLAPPRPSPDRRGEPHASARPTEPRPRELAAVVPTPPVLAALSAPAPPPIVARAAAPARPRPSGAAPPRAARERRAPVGYMMVNGHSIPRPTFEGDR